MIIGLTGSYCSGKDTVAEYLVSRKGFEHRSLSDELRKVLKPRGIEPSRENLIRYGTELREKKGNGILAKMVLKSAKAGRDYCITSIRHPAEVEILKKRKDFVLINVDAPPDIRFSRMRKRNRPGDPETFEKFLEFEKKESQDSGPGQQLAKTAGLASVQFMNDSNSIEELFSKVNQLLATLQKEFPSP